MKKPLNTTPKSSLTLATKLPNQIGGNARAKAFFRQHGVPDSTKSDEKRYKSRAAELYRAQLKREVCCLVVLDFLFVLFFVCLFVCFFCCLVLQNVFIFNSNC
jgi:hypothetical protein